MINSDTHPKFFINNCPNKKMDGDGDGKPCEMIHGLKINGNLINRLVKGWVEKKQNDK
ncbi:MAG: excalibur calcium-binding domain-containing protein [Pseudoalteromonas distincta]|uniref:excalibur calcium-binding domain-containing protein n=1 Tax=Pseudoalteromonas distincta TaxID=77608 RepID=UPI003F9AE8E5